MPTELQRALDAYADLIIKVGLNLQPRQRLLILGSILHGVDFHLAPFVRLVAEKAYAAGASFVDVVWWDPLLDRIRLRTTPSDGLAEYPTWLGIAQLEFAQAADATLALYAEDPDLLADLPPEHVSAYLNAIRKSVASARELRSRNAFNWCIASAPVPGWAVKVLPALPEDVRESRLWQLILAACRMDHPDPVNAWRAHIAELSTRAAYLTSKQYRHLHFSAPGTNLTLDLPPRHIWHGGGARAANGVFFTANLPTEEVFTLPHSASANGTVASTRPFDFAGKTIDRMTLAFSSGQVVDFAAEVGESCLRELLQTDEGASRLGEVALVPHGSPVSQSSVAFHNALFDENAACHLALGAAFKFSLTGGEGLTNDEFKRQGGNRSLLHVDFMIGSAHLDLDGQLASGQSEPLLRGGEWAFPIEPPPAFPAA